MFETRISNQVYGSVNVAILVASSWAHWGRKTLYLYYQPLVHPLLSLFFFFHQVGKLKWLIIIIIVCLSFFFFFPQHTTTTLLFFNFLSWREVNQPTQAWWSCAGQISSHFHQAHQTICTLHSRKRLCQWLKTFRFKSFANASISSKTLETARTPNRFKIPTQYRYDRVWDSMEGAPWCKENWENITNSKVTFPQLTNFCIQNAVKLLSFKMIRCN